MISRARVVYENFRVYVFMLIFLSQQESQSLSLVAPGESILLSCETWPEYRTQSPVPYQPPIRDGSTQRFPVSPWMFVCSIT